MASCWHFYIQPVCKTTWLYSEQTGILFPWVVSYMDMSGHLTNPITNYFYNQTFKVNYLVYDIPVPDEFLTVCFFSTGFFWILPEFEEWIIQYCFVLSIKSCIVAMSPPLGVILKSCPGKVLFLPGGFFISEIGTYLLSGYIHICFLVTGNAVL